VEIVGIIPEVIFDHLQRLGFFFCLDKIAAIHVSQGAVCFVRTSGTQEQGVHLRLESGNKAPGIQDLLQVICLHAHVNIGIGQENVDVLEKQVKLPLHAVCFCNAKNCRHEGRVCFQCPPVIITGLINLPVSTCQVSQDAENTGRGCMVSISAQQGLGGFLIGLHHQVEAEQQSRLGHTFPGLQGIEQLQRFVCLAAVHVQTYEIVQQFCFGRVIQPQVFVKRSGFFLFAGSYGQLCLLQAVPVISRVQLQGFIQVFPRFFPLSCITGYLCQVVKSRIVFPVAGYGTLEIFPGLRKFSQVKHFQSLVK